MKKNLLVAIGMVSGLALTAQVKSEVVFQNVSDFTSLENTKMQFATPLKSEKANFNVNKTLKFKNASNKSNALIQKATAQDSPWYYPEGMFYFGMSQEGSYLYATILNAPSFTDVTWYNMTDWATASKWSYEDPNSTSQTPEILTSDELDLTTRCDGLSLVNAPTLTAINGTKSEDYTLTSIAGQVAGTPAYVAYMPTQSYLGFDADYGVTSFPAAMGVANYIIDDQRNLLAGKCPLWEEQGVKAFVNVFDAPAAAYALNSVYFMGYINNNVPASSAITVTLYKAEKGYIQDGNDIILVSEIGEEIGHCTRTVAELAADMETATDDPTISIGQMIFDEFILLDEDGYESDVLPATDGALAVVITGWADDAAITDFALYTNRQASDASGNYDAVADSRLNTTFYYWVGDDDHYAVNLFDNTNGAVFMDMSYGFIFEESDITEWDIPVGGGDKELSFQSNYSIMDIDGEGMGEWWGLAEEPVFDAETGLTTVKLTALPLEEGVKGRVAKMTVTCWDEAKATVLLTQGDVSGIDNVTAVEKAELDWNAPVYNVMGQKVSKGFTGIAIQNGNKFIVK